MNTRIAALLILPLAFACAGCDGMTGPSSASLEGSWQLVTLQPAGQPAVAPPAGASFAAEFGQDARLALAADCNRCSSAYEAGSGTMSVGAMACTRAYCASAPLDTQFAGLVQAAQNWRLEDGQLVLTSAEGTLRMRR